MRRLDESVPQQLGEILIKHGRPPLTDPKLCENLLKDYCPEHKEEISLLVLGVKERVASDLLVSQDGLQRDLLRGLLIKRLRKAHALSEGNARWIVESWATATRALARKGSVPTDPSPIGVSNPVNPWSRSIIGRCSKAVRSIAVSSTNETIVSGSDDGSIRLWTPETSTLLKQCDAPVSALAFSPNGVLIASASGPIELVDLMDGEVTWLGQSGKQPSLIFSPGGKSLAAASTDLPSEIRVWNLQTGQVRVLKGDWKGPTSISFSPDGRAIVVAGSDRSIRLCDLENGTARVLGQANRQITSVAFLSDGKRVASGSWDETVRLWNVQTGEALILGENCSCVTHLAVSNKGDRIAASSLDGRIRVWDVATRRSRTVGECYGANAISFTANDTALVTGSDDGAVRLWNTAH